MDYISFQNWLDEILKGGLSENAIALNFNLYEEEDENWSVQLIAADEFDPEDEDWVCSEVFSSGEDLYRWQESADWEEILADVCQIVKQYLVQGQYADVLKSYKAVGVGFTDGDIELVYQK